MEKIECKCARVQVGNRTGLDPANCPLHSGPARAKAANDYTSKLKLLAVDLPGATHVEVRLSPGKLWINVDGVCLLRIYHVQNTVVDLPHTQMTFNKVEPVPGLKQDPTGLLTDEGDGKWRMENLMPGWQEKATPTPPADNPQQYWECPNCEQRNSQKASRCANCNQRRTFASRKKKSITDVDGEDGE